MLIENVPFGMVVGGAKDVYDGSFDGIIGLGRRAMCPEHTEPVFHFFSQKGIMSRQFGVECQDGSASFMMGDDLQQLLSTDMTFVNVVKGPYWETSFDWIFVFNTGFSTGDHRMMFDTGAGGISLPGDIHMAMNEILGIKKQLNRAYVFDCEKLPSLPPVEFRIQGKSFKIMPKQYTKQPCGYCAGNVISTFIPTNIRRPNDTLNLFRRISEGLDKLERDKRTMFQIPLYPWGDSQYICKISIEQTEFRMLLDTGSPSIWVPSDRFGDTLIKNTPFGLVMDATEKVSVSPFDGIIGLGRRSMSPEQTQPLLYAVHQQMQMRRKFGFQFQDRGGSFWMGENAKQIFSNDVTYVNVIDGPYWETRTTTNGETTCRTLFYNTSSDCPVGLIMGMSFLHSFQLIFDDNAGKVGFAARSDKSIIF
ncbi:hypothetical protein T265_09454 [Opisthorchis viverrini]|uniref:Peptidase A1 domain-containing protein n=1 Tax=Opisthorchis viverrini TaxID=6198 RepID=A0A074ZA67_OPIVI|nr:hypothetical protein T265_09454 [Opisthorchis viverrini]KER22482.1 hypothetical protein T265_09454 [Opisthorchis viverrini]